VTIVASFVKSVNIHLSTGTISNSSYAEISILWVHKLKVVMSGDSRNHMSGLIPALPHLATDDDAARKHVITHCLVMRQMQI
jgi:hypothetical protein